MAVTHQSGEKIICLAGDGIASRSMALALAKSGLACTIIAPEANRQMGGMQLAPNGWAALDTLGLAQDAEKTIATPFSIMRVMSLDTGFNLVQIPLNTTAKRKPYTSITRQGLSDLLLEACEKTKRVSWHSGSIQAVASNGEKAVITLDDNQVIEADWLFGGDGSTGLCRDYVSAEEQSPKSFTRKAFRMVIDGKACPPGLMGHASNIWLGDGGHIVHYPLASNDLNFVAVNHKAASLDDLKQMLKNHPQGAFLIDYINANQDKILEQPLYKFSTLDAWQRGRIILIGDAAHPMPPHLAQGAGQTLIDAATMLEILQRESHAISQNVITAWAGRRNREIKNINSHAERAGEIFALDGPLAKIRNLGLATIGGRMMTNSLETIWSS